MNKTKANGHEKPGCNFCPNPANTWSAQWGWICRECERAESRWRDGDRDDD